MKSVTKWEDISFLVSSSYRAKVLKSLDKPKTPSQLSRELEINIAHISRALSELEERKMIKCLTPKSTKGKLYTIEKYGRDILREKEKELS